MIENANAKNRAHKSILIEKIVPVISEVQKLYENNIVQLNLKIWGKVIKTMQVSQITRILTESYSLNITDSEKIFSNLLKSEISLNLLNNQDNICVIV